MQYISTRNKEKAYSFSEVTLLGLAPDGGLFVPEEIPAIDDLEMESWKKLKYTELAVEIISIFASDIEKEKIKEIVDKSYKSFKNSSVAPIRKVDNFHILELFYGPTLSFKDYALQFLGNLLEFLLEERKLKVNIVGATSGDTGSAAIHSVKGKKNIAIFILYPNNRISRIQELQMTSVEDENVYCIAVDGTFDDCQRIVKEIFMDKEMKESYNLTAVNSINWARIAAQIVYYVYTCLKFDQNLIFSVPTGNFGNILAAYYAKMMTSKIERLILATNENDILYRFLTEGDYSVKKAIPTISPAMDIQIASNFERYIFYLYERDDSKVRESMEELAKTGKISFPHWAIEKARKDFIPGKAVESEIRETIKKIYEEHGYIIDPHTAAGVKALLEYMSKNDKSDIAFVSVATAHPAKFPEVIEETIGKFEVPEEIKCLRKKDTRKFILPNNTEAVKEFIRKHGII